MVARFQSILPAAQIILQPMLVDASCDEALPSHSNLVKQHVVDASHQAALASNELSEELDQRSTFSDFMVILPEVL